MPFKKPFTAVVLLLHLFTLEVIAQSCETYCTDFENVITNCVGQRSDITSSGPITLTDVDCICTVSTEENMVQCYECNFLTGASLELLGAWGVVCYTSLVSGTVAAKNCFNQELIKGLIGAPCASASSMTVPTSTFTSMTITTKSLTTPVTGPAVQTTVPVSSPTPSPTPSSTPIGAIVGGSVGGFALIAIAAILIFFFIRRSKSQMFNPQSSCSTTAPMQPTLQGPLAPSQRFNDLPASQSQFYNASNAQGPLQFYNATYPEKQTPIEKTHQVYDLPRPNNNKSMANSSDNRSSALVPPYSLPVNYETGFLQQNNAIAPRQNAFELSDMSPYNTQQP